MAQRKIPEQQPIPSLGEKNPLAWAHRLRQRELACEKLTPYQRDAWRAALGQRTSGYIDDPHGDGS